MTQTFLISLASIVGAMVVMWTISLAKRDASIVDPFWGFGFVMVVWLVSLVNAPVSNRMWLLVGMTTVWGVRLSVFLLWRNWGHKEDRRYIAMRQKHGIQFWWRSLFTVFLLQGAIMWIVSCPLQVAAANQLRVPFHWLDGIGVVIWAIGLFFETVGDWQLARFISNASNQGKVLDNGLWRFTRHPNYFGDFCVWWGIYIVALSAGAIWTIVSPLLMSFLLLKVSGVTLLEKTISDRRPEYAAYRERTNAFFPGPPRAIR